MCGLFCAVLWRGFCGVLLALIALPGMLLGAIPGMFVQSCAECRRKENAKLPHKLEGNDVVASFRAIYATQIYPILLVVYAGASFYGGWYLKTNAEDFAVADDDW